MLLLLGLLFLLASETSSLAATNGPCPSGWVDGSWVGMGCLLFDSNTTYTWEEASQYCQTTANASLVEMLNVEQHDFVKMELYILETHEAIGSWWTSGLDLGREGKWYWSSSLYPVGEFMWEMSQPDGGITQNYMYISSLCEPAMGNDYINTSKKFPLCQKK